MERASESVLPVFKSTGAPGIDLSLLWEKPKTIRNLFPTAPVRYRAGKPPVAEVDTGGEVSAQASHLLRHWDAASNNGSIPPDPNMAVGPNHVVVVLNDEWAVFDKNGTELFREDFNSWFENFTDNIFDPKIVYDHHDDRFIWTALAKNADDQTSYWYVMISSGSSGTGLWWFYKLNAKLNGGTPTPYWADYPYIGYDTEAVYVTGNMIENWPFVDWDPKYSKIRILPKSDVYNADPVAYSDLWGMTDNGVDTSFSIVPCEVMSFPNFMPLVNFRWFDPGSNDTADYVVLWKLTNPTTNPAIQGQQITVNEYFLPPFGQQPPGSGGNDYYVPNIDCRAMNAVYYLNYVYTIHTTGYEWAANNVRSALQYYKIHAPSNTITWDGLYGNASYDYFYPAIHVNKAFQDVAIVFGRSGTTEFPSIRHSGRRTADGTMQSSAYVVPGVATYEGSRWGDYFGISLDPDDDETFWVGGQYMDAVSSWKMHVAELNFDTLPDVTDPSGWQNFQPTVWTNDDKPDVSVQVHDTGSGLKPSTAMYRQSLNAGVSWGVWVSADCTGAAGSTSFQTVSYDNAPLKKDSDESRVQFKIQDVFYNEATSQAYQVRIDTVIPTPWGPHSPTQTNDSTPDVSIPITDTLSGLDTTSAVYYFTRNAGNTEFGPFVAACTGASGTTLPQTVTATNVGFGNSSLTQNAVRYEITDVAGNLSSTGWLTVSVDAIAPSGWQNFQPAGVVNGGGPDCSIEVRDDLSGLDVDSGEYRYSTNGGGLWSAWLAAQCSGADGSTQYETVTALNVPFGQSDQTGLNRIMFRVRDQYGNLGTSRDNPVLIDKVALVRGRVVLGDYVGNPNGMSLRLTLYDGVNLVEEQFTTLNALGEYEAGFASTGGTLMQAKTTHHLSVSQVATLSGTQDNLLSWILPDNGDGEPDNQIDLFDLNLIFIHFGNPGPMGDYDGSGPVDVFDLNIVLKNFTKVGS